MSISFDLNVILVRSIYSSNIGAASRAMSNMGAKRLILIDPKTEVDYASHQAAASGQKALSERTVYSSWDDFFAKEPGGIRIAMTARDGRARAVHDLATTLKEIGSLDHVKRSHQSLYLIFGPEDCGLDLKDLEQCHYGCSLPTYGENWSLNLAQAVLLALFILRNEWGGTRSTEDGSEFRPREVKPESTLMPSQTLKTWLETLGYDLSKKRINVYTTIRRMLLHNVPTAREIRILETVLQQNIRKLNEKKEGSK